MNTIILLAALSMPSPQQSQPIIIDYRNSAVYRLFGMMPSFGYGQPVAGSAQAWARNRWHPIHNAGPSRPSRP